MEDTNAQLTSVVVKLYIKLAAVLVCCIAAAVLSLSLGLEETVAIIPAILCLLPVGLGGYYYFLLKKKAIVGTVCTLTKRDKDIAGNIASATVSRHRYYFEYEGENGGMETFWISRNGLTFLEVGSKYFVLHYKDRKIDASNFLSCSRVEN